MRMKIWDGWGMADGTESIKMYEDQNYDQDLLALVDFLLQHSIKEHTNCESIQQKMQMVKIDLQQKLFAGELVEPSIFRKRRISPMGPPEKLKI